MTEAANPLHSSNALPRRLRQLLYLTLAITAWLPEGPTLRAQTPKPTEYQVEAEYLSNFGRFVEWPSRSSAPGEPFNVCVLGSDPFGPSLDSALRGETIAGSPLAAKRISKPEDAGSCRIVFVGAVKESQLNGVLASLRASNALTVSDMSGFSRRGGMIQFVLDGNRVRFEINLAAIQRAGLTVSSELLRVAQAIRRAP